MYADNLQPEKVAKSKGVSMAQVALAWSLTKEPISAAIVGTTSLDHLNDLLGTRSEICSYLLAHV